MSEFRATPLVQFGRDQTLLTRWMARLPVKRGERAYVLVENAEHQRRTNRLQCRSWYERNRGYAQAMARMRYRSDPEGARARLRARYAANPEKYRQRERERAAARRVATAILCDVLERLCAIQSKPARAA